MANYINRKSGKTIKAVKYNKSHKSFQEVYEFLKWYTFERSVMGVEKWFEFIESRLKAETITIPTSRGLKMANFGNWIIEDEAGFLVYSNEEFNNLFERETKKQVEKFVKNKITIEAMLFDGSNQRHCINFIGEENVDKTLNYPNIITSEGVMRVNEGDYIIKEPFDKERGFYPCKPEVFKQTYSKLIETNNNNKEMQKKLTFRTTKDKVERIKKGEIKSLIAQSFKNQQKGDKIIIQSEDRNSEKIDAVITFVQHNFKRNILKEGFCLVSFQLIVNENRVRARKVLEDCVKSVSIDDHSFDAFPLLCGCGVEMSGRKEVDFPDFFQNVLKEVIEERQKREEIKEERFTSTVTDLILTEGVEYSIKDLSLSYNEEGIKRLIKNGILKKIEEDNSGRTFEIKEGSTAFEKGDIVTFEQLIEVYGEGRIEGYLTEGFISEIKKEKDTIIKTNLEPCSNNCPIFEIPKEVIEVIPEDKAEPGTKEEEKGLEEVKIINSIKFFMSGEKMNLDKLKRYYTDRAIYNLIEDKDIELLYEGKQPKEKHTLADDIKNIEILIHNLSFSKGSIVSYNQLTESLSTGAISNLFAKDNIKRVSGFIKEVGLKVYSDYTKNIEILCDDIFFKKGSKASYDELRDHYSVDGIEFLFTQDKLKRVPKKD